MLNKPNHLLPAARRCKQRFWLTAASLGRIISDESGRSSAELFQPGETVAAGVGSRIQGRHVQAEVLMSGKGGGGGRIHGSCVSTGRSPIRKY